MTTTDLLNDLESTNAWQEELYVQLHLNPELSMMETETTAEITRRLESFGYDVQQIGGGVVGVLTNGEGSAALFRADIDALPVQENTGLPYASTKTGTDRDGNVVPVMHACGHDLHITAGLGAAELMSKNTDAWSGTYIALFQPGEETAAGAKSMVADGLVDKIPKPDVALGQHVLTAPTAGKVGTRAGAVLSTGACIKVTVFGKGSHGSMPHLGVDPVVLSASIVTRLQTIVSREIAPSPVRRRHRGQHSRRHEGEHHPRPGHHAAEHSRLRLGRARETDRQHRAHRRGRVHGGAFTGRAGDRVVRVLPADRQRRRGDARRSPGPLSTTSARTGWRRSPRSPRPKTSASFPTAFGIPYSFWGVGGFAEGQQVFPNHNPAFGPAMQPTLRPAPRRPWWPSAPTSERGCSHDHRGSSRSRGAGIPGNGEASLGHRPRRPHLLAVRRHRRHRRPQILKDINSDHQQYVDAASMNLAVSVTALFSGLFIVMMGGFADRLGRVKITLLGIVLGIIGSLLLVFAAGPSPCRCCSPVGPSRASRPRASCPRRWPW